MGTKGGGFFNLFDWNRRSRKKLFAGGNGSPDGKKQVRRSDENLPSTRFHLADDEDCNDFGTANFREGSDYSCASSVTDGEGNGGRAPGVVARLMGLDSLPTSGVSEPCSTPSFESRFMRDDGCRRRRSELEVRNQFVETKDGPPKLLQDWKLQRMPSSPIERFQREMLPPRSARSLPPTHCKLLSPIKNPRFVISSKDAAHIMETASKILLEPGFQTNPSRVPRIDPSSLPLPFRDPKHHLATPQKVPKNLDQSRAPPIESNAIKCLQGRSLNRSWNGSEETYSSSCRSSPGKDQVNNSMGSKSKGKSVSLAIQAKVNVQKREGRNNQSMHREQDEISWSRSLKNQTNIVDHRSKKKGLNHNSSSILAQNNQKQNCLISKDRLPAKRSHPPNHHGKKIVPAEKNRNSNKLKEISKGEYSREGSRTIHVTKEQPSNKIDNVPRKKRLIDGNQQLERTYGNSVSVGRNERSANVCAFIDDEMKPAENTKADSKYLESFAFTSPPVNPRSVSCIFSQKSGTTTSHNAHSNSKGRSAQTNIIIDEKLKHVEDNRFCGTDVESFTFTSPLVKLTFGSESSFNMGKKSATVEDHSNLRNTEWSVPSIESKEDNALSVLLEQKLRGLAFESESYNSSPFKFSSSGIPTPRKSMCSESSQYKKVEQFGEYMPSGMTTSRAPSFCRQATRVKSELQLAESTMECSTSSSTCEELNHYASPFSVLEANFSSESCNSCESYDSNYGNKSCCSSVLGQNATSNATPKTSKVESEPDLSDSASSAVTLAIGRDCPKRINGKKHEEELNYVQEILYTANVHPKYFFTGRTCEKLDPLLFNLLEMKKTTRSKEEEEACSSSRKLLFDSVRECLDSIQGRYFRTGYKAWARGIAVVTQENLTEKIYCEISDWKALGDKMVYELIDKDMNSQLGKSENFESEAFQIGLEIEKKILVNLIDETVLEMLSCMYFVHC